MSNKSFDAFLAKELQANTHYLDDDGFTAQLMRCLPAPKRISPWVEKLITWLPVSFITLLVLFARNRKPVQSLIFALPYNK